MSQRRSFAEETRSPLEQPLIREDTAPENAKGEGECRVMEESVLGSLRQPAPYSLRSSAFQETIEEKACSDPSLQEPKDHSFMFKSVGHSARPSWSRRTFDRARGFFGRVQHSLSVVQPRDTPPTTDVHYRHTFDGSTTVVPEAHLHQSSRDSGGASRGTSFRNTQHVNEVPLTGISSEYHSEGYVDIRGYNHSHSRMSGVLPRENSFVGSIVDLEQSPFQTAQVVSALRTCQRFVIKPNSVFLKVIGWRRFRKETSDLTQPCYIQAANVLYPLLIFILLIMALVLQSLFCFTRSSLFVDSNNGSAFLFCGPQLVTTVIVPDILLLASYIYGLYLVRFQLPEHFYSLMESVFLSFTWVPSANTQKRTRRVVAVLVGFLIAAVCLIVVNIGFNVLRMVAFQPLTTEIRFNPATPVLLEADNTPVLNLSTISPQETRFQSGDIFQDAPDGAIVLLAILLFIGVTMFDFFYVAVIINFALQCQLIIYLIHNISERMLNTTTSIDVAIKEVHSLREYLRILNDRFSHIVSMVIFIFIGITISLLRDLAVLDVPPTDHTFENLSPYILGVVGVVNWVAYTAIPVIQAVRVTNAGRLIRRLGLELRARPYLYAETPMLDLDSFEAYCVNARVQAKLALIPMYPSVVFGILFIGGLGLTAFSTSRGGLQWAPWL